MIEVQYDLDLPEQVRLERRSGIGQILESFPDIRGNERMFLRKMSRVLYEKDISTAQTIWNSLTPQTDKQKIAVTINNETFDLLHSQVQSYLDSKGSPHALQELILASREPGISKRPGYIWNDKHQASQKEIRSLKTIEANGITIHIPDKDMDILKEHHESNTELPIIERAKNSRIVTINGFKGSLMTLVIHDPYDHFFVSTLLREHGVEEQYKAFFDSIGNPANTDLFSREGELVGAISYAYRVWNMVEKGIQPVITSDKIKNLILKSSTPNDNQSRAVEHLDKVVKMNLEQSRKYGYIATSCIIQLLEQRRKQGYIRILDKEYDFERNMSLVEPDYLSLIVETVKLLEENEPLVSRAVSNAAILTEEYFHYILKSKSEGPHNLEKRLIQHTNDQNPVLTMRMVDLLDTSIIPNSSLSPQNTQWITDNPGFTATQQHLKI